MRVLVACEYSAVVREAFRRHGHYAVSCDLLPTEVAGPHIQGDVAEIILQGWDMMLAFPPCTYLCSSGLHWNKRRPERAELTEKALKFVRLLLDAPIPKIVLENPVGCISTRIRKYDQLIHPYHFGHDASKRTCLWLQGLPKLTPVDYVEPRMVGDKPRWGNQTDSGQNRLGPSQDRWKLRSQTYAGIAEAMAHQWGAR